MASKLGLELKAMWHLCLNHICHMAPRLILQPCHIGIGVNLNNVTFELDLNLGHATFMFKPHMLDDI